MVFPSRKKKIPTHHAPERVIPPRRMMSDVHRPHSVGPTMSPRRPAPPPQRPEPLRPLPIKEPIRSTQGAQLPSDSVPIRGAQKTESFSHIQNQSSVREAYVKPLYGGSGLRRDPADMPVSEPKKLLIETFAHSKEPQLSDMPRFQKRSKRIGVWISVGLLFFASVAGVLYVLSSATLTLAITPVSFHFDLGTSMTVSLPAQEISATVTKRGESQSRGEKQFNEKAKGVIVVYNDFGSEPQTLIERTRFQTDSGLIFRSMQRITVPGKSGGKPGSVEVEVVADQTGEKYNVGYADFRIPGFAGTPKYQKFYARSKTEIKGGSIGTGKFIGKEEAEELLVRLESDVRSELPTKFKNALSPDILVADENPDIVILQKITDPAIGSPADTFFGEVRGEMKSMVVDKLVLTETLAKILLKDRYIENSYMLKEEQSTLVMKNVLYDKDKKTLSFGIEGKVVLEAIIPVDELKTKILASGGYDDAQGIFRSYPAIKQVDPVFSPTFLRRIPTNQDRLTIYVKH